MELYVDVGLSDEYLERLSKIQDESLVQSEEFQEIVRQIMLKDIEEYFSKDSELVESKSELDSNSNSDIEISNKFESVDTDKVVNVTPTYDLVPEFLDILFSDASDYDLYEEDEEYEYVDDEYMYDEDDGYSEFLDLLFFLLSNNPELSNKIARDIILKYIEYGEARSNVVDFQWYKYNKEDN